MNFTTKFLLTIFALTAFYGSVMAELDTRHKLVIQISSEDAKSQGVALTYAVNVLNHYKKSEVKVEIVALGSGISLLSNSRKNKLASRVAELAKSGITFSACNNSINSVFKKHKIKPEVIDGVKIIPDGTVRIMRLQEEGYSYIRP